MNQYQGGKKRADLDGRAVAGGEGEGFFVISVSYPDLPEKIGGEKLIVPMHGEE